MNDEESQNEAVALGKEVKVCQGSFQFLAWHVVSPHGETYRRQITDSAGFLTIVWSILYAQEKNHKYPRVLGLEAFSY